MIKLRKLGSVLDGVSATASEASRTATIQVHGRTGDGHMVRARRVRWTAKLGYDSATRLDVTVKTSVDDGDNYGTVQSQRVETGTATLSDYQQQKDSGSSDLSIDGYIDCEGATHVQIILAGNGGGADDTLTLIAAIVEEA